MRKLWSVLLCAGLLLSPAFAQQTDEQQEFEQYKSVLKTDAIDAGFGRQFVENVFAMKSEGPWTFPSSQKTQNNQHNE